MQNRSVQQDEIAGGRRRVRQASKAGEGVLRLAPTWVPALVPGRRAGASS